MREIKFRGKTLDGLRWVYGDLIQENSGRVVIRTNLNTWAMNNDVNPYGEILDVIPDTVGQYTGLQDRNGKDVYEGDIVRWYEVEPERAYPRVDGGYMDCTTNRIQECTEVVQFYQGSFGLGPLRNIINGFLPWYKSTLPMLCMPYEGGRVEFSEDDPDYPDNRDEFPGVEKSDLYRAEIIGNIHDNPELLEDEL